VLKPCSANSKAEQNFSANAVNETRPLLAASPSRQTPLSVAPTTLQEQNLPLMPKSRQSGNHYTRPEPHKLFRISRTIREPRLAYGLHW
jgi:hypothetical protein